MYASSSWPCHGRGWIIVLAFLCHTTDSLSVPWLPPPSAIILHQNPLVYTLPNLLSREECRAYQEYVLTLESQGHRSMTRSNPPLVSVDRSKLWPLPFLSLAAGIPSVMHTTTTHQDDVITPTLSQLVQVASFPIFIAICISMALVAAAPPLLQALSNRTARTSVAMALNQAEDISFVTPLVERIVTLTGHPWNQWEAPVVTRYDPGAIFAKHGDASQSLGSEWINEGGQRVITCICYLNDCPNGGGGGETYFEKLNLAVVPEPGKALIFFPANCDSLQADDQTIHESLSPKQDEKWIVQLFGRVGPRVPPPLGLPDEYSTTTSFLATTSQKN